jgi:hypothetical protein
MLCVGFEPTITAFEWTKTVHASDRSITVAGYDELQQATILFPKEADVDLDCCEFTETQVLCKPEYD